MAPESLTAAAGRPSGMSEVSRISGVFFEPVKTFQDIAQRPRFWAPLILMVILGIGFTVLLSQRIGWERIVRQQTEMSPGAQQKMENMPAEQRERIERMQQSFAPLMAYGAAFLARPLGYLLVAAILLGIVRGLLSASVTLKQVYAVICYAALPDLFSTILTTIVMFLKDPDEFNLMNPLAFNPGAFMDPVATSRFVYTLASALDAFTIWKIVLTAIGLRMAANCKISFGGALAAVAVPWAVLTLGGAVFAGLFR